MFKKIHLVYALLSIAALSSNAFAVKPSWWGGEIQSIQKVGYGKYEIKMIPGKGAGSITGFFNLCYSTDHQNCIDWTDDDKDHFETDIEFTPTGNEAVKRRWITAPCLTDSSCNVTMPSPWPRDGSKNLLAASLNTFPSDNQVYYQMDPYSTYHTYTFVNLPNEVYWEIDGKKILSRVPSSSVPIRNFPQYKSFQNALRNNNVKLIINVWDGSQGDQGGFGGPGTVQQTEGEAKVTRVAYYPANCNGNNCTIATSPTFLMDYDTGQFIKNGQSFNFGEGVDLCAKPGQEGITTFWTLITRTDYPVYVSPSHVNCRYIKARYLGLKYTRTQ